MVSCFFLTLKCLPVHVADVELKVLYEQDTSLVYICLLISIKIMFLSNTHSQFYMWEKSIFLVLYLKFLNRFGSSLCLAHMLVLYYIAMKVLLQCISFGYHRTLENCHHFQLSRDIHLWGMGSFVSFSLTVIESPWFRFQSGSAFVVRPVLFGSDAIPH